MTMAIFSMRTVIASAFALSTACVMADTVGDRAIDADAPMVSAALINSARAQGIDLNKTDFKPGVHIKPLADSWFTGELAETMKRQIAEQERNGFHRVENREIPDIQRAVASAKASPEGKKFVGKRYASMEELRPRLFAEPLALGHSQLATARLVDAGTAGGLENGLWTGVARYFDVPGMGLVMLEELDHAIAKASVTTIEEWINADVNGHPAIAKTARTATGRTLVSVSWTTDRMSYSLLLQPSHPDDVTGNQDALIAMARDLGS